MVKGDNSAGRFYQTLAAAQKERDGTRTALVWMKVLNVEENRLFRALSNLQLTWHTIQTVLPTDKDSNHALLLKYSSEISAVIRPENLTATWAHYKNRLKPEVMDSIENCAHQFRRITGKIIDFKGLKKFKEEIVTLQEQIQGNSWEPGLKYLTIGYLSRILETIDDYIATGIDRFEDIAVQGYGTIAVIIRTEGHSKEPATTQSLWEKIEKLSKLVVFAKTVMELLDKGVPYVKALLPHGH